jgi:hypothetical protein
MFINLITRVASFFAATQILDAVSRTIKFISAGDERFAAAFAYNLVDPVKFYLCNAAIIYCVVAAAVDRMMISQQTEQCLQLIRVPQAIMLKTYCVLDSRMSC